MGGLIGYGHVVEIHQNASSAELKGDITFGTTYRIGGLVGYDAWMNQYYYNIFSGTFTNVNLINAGGIVGECQKSNCYFYYSYWDKEFSGLLNVCGVSKTDCDNSLGKTTNFLKTPSNLISILPMAWSFANNNSDNYSADFWDISHITGYPVPFWIEYDHVLDSPFAGGDGSEENPFIIMTADHLNKIGRNNYLQSLHYKLGANIDYLNTTGSFEQWNSFYGTLDGQNYSLSNFDKSLINYSFLNLPQFSMDNYYVLVHRDSDGKLLNGTIIKNLKIDDFNSTNGSSSATIFSAIIFTPLKLDLENVHVTNASLINSAFNVGALLPIAIQLQIVLSKGKYRSAQVIMLEVCVVLEIIL